MKFGYVMKEGKPVRILHGSVAVTYDSFGGRHEHPVSFIEADSWEEAVNKITSASNREPVGLSDKLGDCAALRDALQKCVVELEPYCDGGCRRDDVLEEAKAALAKPYRNCDMFGGDFKMLHTAWFDWTGSPSGQNPDGTAKMGFGEWLLALAGKRGAV